MTDTAARPFHYGKDVFLYPLLICLVFFFVGGYAVYETSLSAADQTIQHMLQRVKERSLYSLRFEDVDRVNSLVRLMDKAKELARQTEEHPENLQETLARFQRDMRLTGAVLLNDKLEADAVVGIASEDWRRIVNMSHIPDVIRWPQKNSMDRIRLNGQFYDYAAVARRDKPGIVLTIDNNDTGERKSGLFTLDILFPDDSFLLKSAVFITDGTVIIDTNDKDWLGRSVAESPLADFETSSQVRSNLVRRENPRERPFRLCFLPADSDPAALLVLCGLHALCVRRPADRHHVHAAAFALSADAGTHGQTENHSSRERHLFRRAHCVRQRPTV